MLDEMDRQIGRLVDFVDSRGQGRDTLILFVSDNGPTAWPRYYQEGLEPPGSTSGLRGRKWSLHEGGIRVPLIARWTGRIRAGRSDRRTVVSTLDLLPTFLSLTGVDVPRGADFDGENMAGAIMGNPQVRRKDLLWDYGRDETYVFPGKAWDRSPNLAIRRGRWKLLTNADGSRTELYDFGASDRETENVAERRPDVARRLKQDLLAWRRALPAVSRSQG